MLTVWEVSGRSGNHIIIILLSYVQSVMTYFEIIS